MTLLTNAMELSRELCRLKLRDGDRAVDCTMGQGKDTLLLCRLVGEKGHVTAFDVQKEAIAQTRKLLKEEGMDHRCRLVLDGHENLSRHVNHPVDLFLFNLGYLPGSSRQIRTQPGSTTEALEQCQKLLKKGGLILVVVYPGHPEGMEELVLLEKELAKLDQKVFTVAWLRFANQKNHPPQLICIEKR